MGKKLKSLEECLQALNRFAEASRLGIDAELIGINELRDETDIQKFIEEFKKYLGPVYSRMIQKKDEKLQGLLDAGYSIDNILEFYLYDRFTFTLGHIYNNKTLKAWYPVLEERWKEEDQDRFGEMYKVILSGSSFFPEF